MVPLCAHLAFINIKFHLTLHYSITKSCGIPHCYLNFWPFRKIQQCLPDHQNIFTRLVPTLILWGPKEPPCVENTNHLFLFCVL